MDTIRLDLFDLAVDERFSVEISDDRHLYLTCTEPVLVVRCAVIETRPDASDGRGALLAVSSVAEQQMAAGARVLDSSRSGVATHAVRLEDPQGHDRIFGLAVQRGDRVLVVQGRSPTSIAAEADELVSRLIAPLAGS